MTDDEHMSGGGHEDPPIKEPDEYCNAHKADGSGYCQHTAGWGTDHTGHGRCKFHGGSTEAQEKGLIAELEDAADDATVALRLRIKHLRQDVEDPDAEVDWQELDRLARTILDRAPNAPNKTETQEVTGEGGGPVEIELNETVVETDYDE
jgi:hypothetical protein